MANSVVIIALFLVAVTKFIDYTAKYHSNWLMALSLKTNSKDTREYNSKLRKQRQLIEENHSISAQDNYAKWTKNNRQLDKLKIELSELDSKIKLNSKNLHAIFHKLKLITLTLPFFVFKIWKGKEIVYYLPTNDTFPYLISGVWNNGWLHLVLTPLNYILGRQTSMSTKVGVSFGIWIWALTNVISNIESLIKFLLFTEKIEAPKVTSQK
ncbi:hypothetical protein KAFR_0F03190 [Kazachstania africana CBS 2517]|uniref:Golgi to ER traffic protein 1 n=1 Tax=Kazachstania africana (strain ATCC 22294 / BCRC 22015 / CBS 2517 / CECT 1963 / NBRC 1671 / NRRL Y-8276) TaxID=1071382 RepID=H2AX15_KAZAF|nr:hypothetical protein KAFR_0F03190 [Kazachstania africana CBS 2517]CCF58915.1 hypothetical protein KAFR_0F03190 [Kazachstania africana CBS 2517]